ncbi:hypothetical protein DL990_32060 [Amycolatopsis sp. WAC 01416]|uniref:hypothetical protein n=1 Tax=Amycolatopsis sp. WAC 01416 TaxID=2203196 RepID=UPI000F7B36CE|nr:hypothetical protein [Amycolatopsis sp. WAC 01416]RSN26080.1 hypothetical protein DL990_32060 [Amycolatopsis sp. WAC 01416]
MLDQRTTPIAVPGAKRRPRLPVTILAVFLVIAGILGYVVILSGFAEGTSLDVATAAATSAAVSLAPRLRK